MGTSTIKQYVARPIVVIEARSLRCASRTWDAFLAVAAEVGAFLTPHGGVVSVETVDASVLGFGLPTALVDGVVQILATGLQQYPLGMQATAVSVDDNGVNLTLEGGRFTMPAPQEGQQQQQGCSLI